MRPSLKWRGWKQWLLIGVAACVSMHIAGRRAAAELTVSFTASTDFTGPVPNGSGTFGYSYPNDPVNQNPNLPAISTGVTLSPGSGGFDGNTVGPLPDGSTYGPFGYATNAGGSTGWVTTSYKLPTTGSFQLVWEVANVINCAGSDALATDNIRINGKLIFPFQTNALPAGFTGVGNYGTSGAVADLAPSRKDAAFAWMDVAPPPNSTNVKPIFDTVDGYSASQLYSAVFTANAGDTLKLDAAFLTNDGSPYADYGIVALQTVPEPSSLILAALGAIGMAGHALRRHLARTGCS